MLPLTGLFIFRWDYYKDFAPSWAGRNTAFSFLLPASVGLPVPMLCDPLVGGVVAAIDDNLIVGSPLHGPAESLCAGVRMAKNLARRVENLNHQASVSWITLFPPC